MFSININEYRGVQVEHTPCYDFRRCFSKKQKVGRRQHYCDDIESAVCQFSGYSFNGLDLLSECCMINVKLKFSKLFYLLHLKHTELIFTNVFSIKTENLHIKLNQLEIDQA